MSDSIQTKATGSPRKTMETSAASGFKNASGEASSNTKPVKRGGAQAGDPTIEGKPSRSSTKIKQAGARYGVRVSMPSYKAPEAGSVQGNGRIIPPAINRTRSNFSAGGAE